MLTVRDARAQPLSELRAKNLRQLRRQRKIERTFNRGSLRSRVELIEELIRHRLVAEEEIDRRLDIYARVDPVALDLTGATKLIPAPLRVVGGSRR